MTAAVVSKSNLRAPFFVPVCATTTTHHTAAGSAHKKQLAHPSSWPSSGYPAFLRSSPAFLHQERELGRGSLQSRQPGSGRGVGKKARKLLRDNKQVTTQPGMLLCVWLKVS